TVLEAALGNQPQGTRDRVRCSQPGRRSRGTLGTAAQARTESRFGGRRSGRKITDILLSRRRRRTDRAAINPAAQHTNKEFAVKTRVSREPSPRADLQIQFHAVGHDSRLQHVDWTFSDEARLCGFALKLL